MSTKPSIPKGTRDFNPLETARRNYIFDTIKQVFELHGFSAIETPAMENLSTLLGKYGDEGDKLLFRILNSGDFLSNVDKSLLGNGNSQALSSQITEKGLRYDLTVPFARFVAQHQHELTFPFKRFQIQPVWRADRPQKGRYREFYQCDADVIGSDSLFNEFEILQLINEVFTALNIPTTVHINNRKLLMGITELLGCADNFLSITTAIDKLDKAGREAVQSELIKLGLSANTTNTLFELLELKPNNDKIKELEVHLQYSEIGRQGISEIKELLEYTEGNISNSKIIIDTSLARGLDYYTGAIFEVKANKANMGSICGGGRYDNLTGVFGLQGVSGVGISFGADRIFDLMCQWNLFPENIGKNVEIMFVNFGKTESIAAISLINELRGAGISAMLYPDLAKMKKQLQYAVQNQIEMIALMGEDEIANGIVSLKNLTTGLQENIPQSKLIHFLSGCI